MLPAFRHRLQSSVLVTLLAVLPAVTGCGRHSTAPASVSIPPTPHTWEDLHLATGLATADALAEYGGELIAGGDFWDAANVAHARLVALNGLMWRPLGAQPDEPVRALAMSAGRLYAGGDLLHAGAAALGHVGVLEGSLWDDLAGGVNDRVLTLLPWGSGIVAGGAFTTAGGVAASRVAAWNGTAWQALGPGLDGTVWSLANDHGELIAGGEFGASGGSAMANIARWDGAAWQPLGAPGAMTGTVRALCVLGDTLFTGGGAEWDGQTWRPLSSLSGLVHALQISGGRLYAGGAFAPAPGAPQNGVTRWVK